MNDSHHSLDLTLLTIEGRASWRSRMLSALLRTALSQPLDPDADIAALRQRCESLDARYFAPDRRVVRAAIDCAGVRAEWVSVPESRCDRTVFYLHGGSFAFRFPNAHAAFAARLCRRLGARAVIPDYRLAPEHPFPAATNDSAWLPTAGCWAAVARHTARSSSVTPPAATSRW